MSGPSTVHTGDTLGCVTETTSHMALSPELQAALVDALRAAVKKICVRCAAGFGISKSDPNFHAVLDLHGQEIGCTVCRAADERALLARVEAEAPK